MDRGANYPSWMALSSRRVELEQQSGDETEEEHSQQDCQMPRRAVNPQRWDEAGEASFDPMEFSDG